MILMRKQSVTRLRGLVALVAATPLLAACGGVADGSGTGPRVVASFYPLQYVAGRVAGEHAEVVDLTGAGVEPHDLELTIKQVAELSEADVVVYSDGFQPAVDDAVDQSEADHVVDASEVADLEAENGDQDPHFWLDPVRLGTVAAALGEQLSAADPEHAEDYAGNLEALQGDLAELDDEIGRGLQDCERDLVVVSHDAFGYFADRYGLEMAAINGLSPEAEPSPAHLRELSDLIDSEGITTVFSERLASAELADSLAGDLGLETAVLDPIEGLSDESADEDYLSLMRANLAALENANGCS